MTGGLIGSDSAALDKLIDKRMIFGNGREGSALKQIQAAIANMAIEQLAAVNNGGGTGGAHAVQLGMRFHVAQDGLLGAGEAGQENFRLNGRALFEHGAKGIQSKNACDFAAGVAAHAVGDGDQASFAIEVFFGGRLQVAIIIFIFGADVAGVICPVETWLRINTGFCLACSATF